MTDHDSEAQRRDHFRIQAGHCEKLGSPFTALLCRTLADGLDHTSAFGRRALAWPLQTLSGDLLALRCCGALHYRVRCEPGSELAKVYPPHPTPDAHRLWDAVRATIAAHDEALTQFLDTPPQTNEVSRTAIVLGGLLHVAGRWRMPLSLMEIGASAGLNLNLDRFAYDFGRGRQWGGADSRVRIRADWRGEAPGLDPPIEIAARIGNDQSPLNVKNEDDRRRLLSYVWPDQDDRLKRIDAALAIASKHPVQVIQGDAAEFLAAQLAQDTRPGIGRFVFHTIVLQYASKQTRAAVKQTLAEAGARASDKTPLARFSMEHEKPDQPATMRLTLWPGGEERIVGQCDSHGAWRSGPAYSRPRADGRLKLSPAKPKLLGGVALTNVQIPAALTCLVSLPGLVGAAAPSTGIGNSSVQVQGSRISELGGGMPAHGPQLGSGREQVQVARHGEPVVPAC